ncbi:putative low complexity protein perhaps membrane associated [Cryptosporidium felis]|nr:putative low complexity protein perhaps membrane associated [Cryptosporidium felis]
MKVFGEAANLTTSKIISEVDSAEHFWFDYRIWCLLLQINIDEINSIEEFMSNMFEYKNDHFIYNESTFFELEKKPSYRLVRCDFERFRPHTQNLLSYPIIPNGFYGEESIEELSKEIYGTSPNDDFSELFLILSNDSFSIISNLDLVDRLVITTIILCEYLSFEYFQGIHEIVGCLAFLKTHPVPIIYHIFLASEIIKRWAQFLILPNILTHYNNYLSMEKIENTEKKYWEYNNDEIEINEDNLLGFISNYFVSDQENTFISAQISELSFKKKSNEFEPILKENSIGRFPKIAHKKVLNSSTFGELSGQKTPDEQIVVICNEFQYFGYFHLPSLFGNIERKIGSSIWSCGVFITCGGSLFFEVTNVLLFWLNLIFSSSEIKYKPPLFPKIPTPLQLTSFLLTILRSFERLIKNDIFLICTDEFKLDQGLSSQIGALNIANQLSIYNNEKYEYFVTFSKDLRAKTENARKGLLFLDILQVVLAMESLLSLTPISLQKRIITAATNFDPSSTTEYYNVDGKQINFIEPTELLIYDNDYSIKNVKNMNGMFTFISGKDVVILDILSSYYLDNIIEVGIERLIKRLEFIEELVRGCEYKCNDNLLDLHKAFDEELISIILLPLLRRYLKTTRIVKIPIDKDKEYYISNQVFEQLIEFTSRRQHALSLQNRPCVWIISGPKHQIKDELLSRLLFNGISGVQLIDSSTLFTELLGAISVCNGVESIISIIKHAKSNLYMGNYKPNYRSRKQLKNGLRKKLNSFTGPMLNNNSQYDKKKTLNTEKKEKSDRVYIAQGNFVLKLLLNILSIGNSYLLQNATEIRGSI